MKPDFIIVGASRSGTTTLYHVLRQHSEIFMPARKELQFYFNDMEFNRGMDYYEAYFELGSNKIRGEASPPYFHKGILCEKGNKHKWAPDDDAPLRIKETLPNVKIIITLRNPIYRAHSQFWKNKWQGTETVDTFEEAIEQEIRGQRKPTDSALCWLYKNTYSIHICRWLELFNSKQVQFMIFEEWTRNPTDHMQKIGKFLGCVEHIKYVESGKTINKGRMAWTPSKWLAKGGNVKKGFIGKLYKKVFTRPGYPEISSQTYQKLHDYFSEDVSKLRRILNNPLAAWSLQ